MEKVDKNGVEPNDLTIGMRMNTTSVVDGTEGESLEYMIVLSPLKLDIISYVTEENLI